MMMGEMWSHVGSTMGSLIGERMKRSEVYSAIKTYLSDKSSASTKRLKADVVQNSQSVVLSMDYNEEVTDEFQGVKIWWSEKKTPPRTQRISWYPDDDEKKFYKLTVHKRHRELITQSYVSHVLKEKLLQQRTGSESSTLTILVTIEEIKNDLIKFSKGKDYYARIGKAWKRGYLLYGPPGTGKSSMISAMANLLDYDVYDLELTAVKENTELRRLLIDTSNKSIVVIEDIDCSLDLTGQRKKKKEEKDSNEEELDPVAKRVKEEEKKESKVTLSGLLNCIDGLWSACGGERIIIFTTNHVEKLDPALIRRGRMDKHIEMSYCCFDAFKVLA
ncbi:hypothetical protein CRYUN_Cryun17cG0029600 [Craigia yunnanensis]